MPTLGKLRGGGGSVALGAAHPTMSNELGSDKNVGPNGVAFSVTMAKVAVETMVFAGHGCLLDLGAVEAFLSRPN